MSDNLLSESVEPLLLNALSSVLEKIKILSNDSNFVEKMSLVFGNTWNSDRARVLLRDLESGNIPKIELVSSSQINGAQGAFDHANNAIYLSQEFLCTNVHNSSEIENVLLEEFGHFIDSQINTTDATGDEGAIFAAIVRGESLSDSQLASLKTENDTTTAVINGQAITLELATSYGNIAIDGNLSDWTSFNRLDFVPGTGLPGYELYGKYAGDAYVFALKSDGTQIGSGTTFWLNSDRNSNTGYKIFGFAGGAEYNVNFFSDNQPYLYTGADGEIPVGETIAGRPLNYAFGDNNRIVEFAIPISQLSGVSPNSAIDVLVDVNNQAFLPPDYSSDPFTLETNLPQRTDFSKKVAIIFSETTAKNFFDEKAYTQLFMSMQYQAMMAGVPFDILTEDDLTDINKVVNYDAILFPSFRNVKSSQLDAISDTLSKAVYKYNIGLITAGDFLTNDETGAAIAGDSYIRMKQLLDVTRTTGGGPVDGNLKAENVNNPVMERYAPDEIMRSYKNLFFNVYGDGLTGDGKTPLTLADFEVGSQSYNAMLATQTGGRNVHFATEAFLGDNNLVWQALQWVIYDNKPTVRLNMSRDASIFLSRNDMDQSQFAEEVPNVAVPLYNILVDWKNKYNFVGSYYINVGNNPQDGAFTNWEVSGPLYRDYVALGNEIGTHSYTHLLYDYNPPNDTNVLTPAQLEFEFNQSKLVIERELGKYIPGFKIVGAAIPGQPEGLYVNNELRKYLPYVTGGYASVGAGYPGAFGFMFPGDDYVYFAPNMSFDFSLIGFKGLTPQQAEAAWKQEYAEITNKAAQPIVLFPWHDYGPTLAEPGYTKEMFDNFIAQAYNDNTEFVTFADLYDRIKTFEQSQLFIDENGNAITAKVIAGDVGKFSLNVDGNLPIKSVNNWYAYDQDTVFLPKAGGEFTINLGTTPNDVTRIIDLPMRAELLSLTGNGSDLSFSFIGEGEIVLDLKAANGKNYLIEGGDSRTLNGEILKLKFNAATQHSVNIRLVDDNPPTVANPIADVIVDEDASDTIIDLSNLFTDSDNDRNAIVKTVLVNSNGELVTSTIVGNILTLDYLPNQFGTANITIRGTSNGLTVDDTFTVTVNPVDDAPTVANPIANVSVDEDAANTIIDLSNVFDDIDSDRAATIKSILNNSNPNLVNASIVGNNLILAYQPNQFGTANITIRGTSNGKTADSPFTVGVNPVDDAPVVVNAIADVTVNRNAPDTIINLSNVFTDIDNDPNAIVKTVVNNNGTLVNASISGNNLILDYQPNQFGSAQITIRGTSNGKTVEDSFVVNVVGTDNPPTVANPITNVVVDEDAVNTVIDLRNVFTDSDDDPNAIIKTLINNSNSNLVNASIVGNNLILAYQPNGSGTAQITIRGTSGSQFVDNTFSITVNPVDDAPIVTNPIADVIVDENAPNTVIDLANVFTDIDSAAIAKTVSVNDNPSLVAVTIVNNTLTLDYQRDRFGTANITVRGISNGKIVEDTFTVTVNAIGNVINGNNSNNDLKGTSGRDILYGLGGNDKIDGKEENDALYGGTGNDELKGDKGNDLLSGEAGNDKLNGEDGNDILSGGDGSDQLDGGENNDLLHGNAGSDQLDGKDGEDTLYGGSSNDTLNGEDGNDILYGDGGSDSLNGGQGSDILIGVDPNLPLAGIGEIDVLKGDKNSDRFILGDINRAYYNDENDITTGTSDYALISDFSSREGDIIQLHGNASNYRLSNVSNGTAIYLKTSGQDELIGIVAGANNLNLNGASFSFSI